MKNSVTKNSRNNPTVAHVHYFPPSGIYPLELELGEDSWGMSYAGLSFGKDIQKYKFHSFKN